MTMWPGFEGAANTSSQQTDKNSPEKANNTAHERSDLDSGPYAQHHTLGISPGQASPGDHSHDGKSSRKVKASDISGLSTAIANAITANPTIVTSIINDTFILAAIERHPGSVAGYIRSNMLAVFFSGSRNTDSWRQQVMTAFVALGCTNSTTS